MYSGMGGYVLHSSSYWALAHGYSVCRKRQSKTVSGAGSRRGQSMLEAGHSYLCFRNK